MLAKFAAHEIDVLVGTQMIAKGHDFHNVTLVGVISADVGLGLADFRAAERTFQLLTQVAGRAGRGDRPGEAIVQTLYPDHYSIRHACRQDYQGFFDEEIKYRRAMRYPPSLAMVNVIVRGRSLGAALEAAADLVRRCATAGFGVPRSRPRACAVREAPWRIPRAVLSQGTPREAKCGGHSSKRSPNGLTSAVASRSTWIRFSVL